MIHAFEDQFTCRFEPVASPSAAATWAVAVTARVVNNLHRFTLATILASPKRRGTTQGDLRECALDLRRRLRTISFHQRSGIATEDLGNALPKGIITTGQSRLIVMRLIAIASRLLMHSIYRIGKHQVNTRMMRFSAPIVLHCRQSQASIRTDHLCNTNIQQ